MRETIALLQPVSMMRPRVARWTWNERCLRSAAAAVISASAPRRSRSMGWAHCYMSATAMQQGHALPVPPVRWTPASRLEPPDQPVRAWDGSRAEQFEVEPVEARPAVCALRLREAGALFVAHRRALPQHVSVRCWPRTCGCPESRPGRHLPSAASGWKAAARAWGSRRSSRCWRSRCCNCRRWIGLDRPHASGRREQLACGARDCDLPASRHCRQLTHSLMDRRRMPPMSTGTVARNLIAGRHARRPMFTMRAVMARRPNTCGARECRICACFRKWCCGADGWVCESKRRRGWIECHADAAHFLGGRRCPGVADGAAGAGRLVGNRDRTPGDTASHSSRRSMAPVTS
jgi:hypothetical protein